MARRFKVRDYKAGLVFNGAGYVQLPALSTSSGISVSAWIKTPTPVPPSAIDILGRSSVASDLLEVTSTGQIRFNINTSGGVNNNLSAANVLPKNKFVHVTATYNISTGVSKIYLNSILISSLTAGSGTFTNNANTWMLGALTSATRLWLGNLLEVGIWDAELTSIEIANLYYDGIIPRESQLKAFYLCDEGAGTTLNDISGNLQNGTITTATFNADVPFVVRKNVNSNLVKNGSVDYIPPFTAAGTTSARWIDGTSGGSTTNDIFGWAQVIDTASASAKFDFANSKVGKYSLRVDTLDASGRARVCQGGGSGGTAGSIAIATLKKYGIPVKPSTSYTFGAWVKYTNVLTGNCNFQIDEMDGTGTRVASSNNAFGSGTSDWVYKTLTFTTSATTQFLVLALGFNSAGEVKTAWFDDISLYQTTPVTRTTNTQSRLKVRNMGTSFHSASSSSDKVVTTPSSALSVTSTSANGLTCSFWYKYNNAAGQTLCRFNSQDDTLDCLRINIESTTQYLFVWSVDSGGVGSSVLKPTVRVPKNSWVHITYSFIYDSNTQIGTAKVYLNGTLLGTGTRTGYNQRQSGNFKFGGSNSADQFVDDIRVFNRVLNSGEINDIYLNGNQPADAISSAALWWKFDEGSGTTAQDSSGNGNTGAITFSGTASGYSSEVPTKLRTPMS